jgi:hypothetical protein
MQLPRTTLGADDQHGEQALALLGLRPEFNVIIFVYERRQDDDRKRRGDRAQRNVKRIHEAATRKLSAA